ncbi:MAG: TolC family protein [Gluconacetobacter diazotrophicus]|nr:TolC family protein [Gluconacetobacter diazotrophicus]
MPPADPSRRAAPSGCRRPLPLAVPLAVSLAVLLAGLSGCNDTRDLAPPDPSTPWRPTVDLRDAPAPAENDKAAGARSAAAPPGTGGIRDYGLPHDRALPFPDPHAATDPAHDYSLLELVDVAQRNNKQTRIAWEQARQAAIGVGLTQSLFLPQLTLSALGGYRRETTPQLVTQGYITSNAEALFPTLTITYLLLDFGARDAALRAAKETSEAANVSFTGVHQQLILSVARSYFSLQSAEAQLGAADTSLRNAQLLSTAAHSRLQHGEGTITDADDTDRDVAQARFGIASATAARNTARDTLLTTLGLPPRTPLRVESLDDHPVPRGMSATLDELTNDALRSRPDLLADLARLRASQADTARARADLYPKVSLNVKGSGDIGRLEVDNGPNKTFIAPETGVYLDFEWTFYQGGYKANQLRLAQSREAENRDVLQAAEDGAMREVAVAYDELEAGLVQYDAAVALQRAARTSFAANADAYGHGVGTITAANTAETALNQADATLARTHAQVLASAATLAFAAGQLTSAQALAPPAPAPPTPDARAPASPSGP